MRSTLPIVAAALAAALGAAQPASAADETVIGDWNAFCLATDGDPAQAVAKARAAGWIQKPVAMDAEAAAKFETLHKWVSDDGPRPRMLMVLRQKRKPDGSQTDQCMTSGPTALDDLAAPVAALLGDKHAFMREEGPAWLLESVGGRFRPLTDDDMEAARKAAEEGRTALATAFIRQGVAFLSLERRRE